MYPTHGIVFGNLGDYQPINTHEQKRAYITGFSMTGYVGIGVYNVHPTIP